ncbi:MAG TPA: amidohydrolase family protein [Streptosporangiaceae bacterium]|nr:amidohydrolase family protein [Streptosporangiaceae bacterium]
MCNATVLTPGGRLRECDLAIVEGRIGEMMPRLSSRRGWDCSALLIIPGLANAHFHGASTLLRGLNAGLQLAEWGNESPAGREQARLFGWLDGEASDDEVRALVAYEYVEQLRQGVTFIADDGLAQGRAPGAAAAMDDVGIRGVVNAHDQAVDLVGSDPARYLAPLLDEDELTETSLRAVVAFAERFDSARLAAHCLETQARRQRVFAEFGRSSVEVFAEAGLLRRGTVLYHCVHTEEADLRILAASGAALVHCPVSNLFGGDVARTSRWLRHGLTVGIGTDFARTDLWEAARLAYLLLRAQSGADASAVDVLGWATAGGQQAYGYTDRGRVEPGVAADLVLLDMARLTPVVDRPGLSTAAYAVLADTRPSCVRHVLVGGRPVLTDGDPALVDADAITRKRHDLVARVGGGI